MAISLVLLVILFILMAIIGGGKGMKSFFMLCLNFAILFYVLALIAKDYDPIKTTVCGCIVITSATLIYINGFNKKTVSSILAVSITVLITMSIIYKMGVDSKIQGFSAEEIDSIGYLSLSYNVNLNFMKIFICQVLVGLLGAIIDTSISISSPINEIYNNNKDITKYDLFKSGMNIGRDILGTMTNTLLFVYIGSFMSLILYFNVLNYSASEIINRKVFAAEVFQVLCSGIGVVLIIPITAFITTEILYMKKWEK
ncbi:MAG: YibE/F family protein [Clostridiaceae bacterium]